jgi:hypothetical protein
MKGGLSSIAAHAVAYMVSDLPVQQQLLAAK